jgi:prepilin-type N-terminal cleavage/methylation domain-containing protein
MGSISPRAARCTRGFTLLEVMLSISILVVSLLGMAEFGRRFSRANAIATIQQTATDLASSRVERVKAERNYISMDSCAVTESGPPNLPSQYTRRTIIVRTLDNAPPVMLDYKTVTVVVTHPRLATPVSKTTAIAAF